MPHLQSTRSSSVELGNGDYSVTYNERTGRPVRKSAGQRNLDLLNTVKALEQLSDIEDSDDETDEEDPFNKLPSRSKQKIRPLEPLPQRIPDLPLVRDELGAICQPIATQNGHDEACQGGVEILHLTFNISPGFEGPLRVEIPMPTVLRSGLSGSNHDQQSIFSSRHPICQRDPDHDDSDGLGWPCLPAEIRNRIYRFLFVQQKTLSFDEPTNFRCSSQFLRTCKQVHSEGCEILYSENSFTFQRNKQSRTPYWSFQIQEVGFTDVRRFLESIGKRNISVLRDVTFICEDAWPSTTPTLNNEERRFTNDPNLLECLRILSKQGRLRKLHFCFIGRRYMSTTDDRFLVALKAMRADEVKVIPHPKWSMYDGYEIVAAPSKLPTGLKKAIEAKLTRKRKLWLS